MVESHPIGNFAGGGDFGTKATGVGEFLLEDTKEADLIGSGVKLDADGSLHSTPNLSV